MAFEPKWEKGDGLLEAQNYDRYIYFRNGSVTVRDQGYNSIGWERSKENEIKCLEVPAGHRIEVLGGPEYYFVKTC
jgi:hypothetical protein